MGDLRPDNGGGWPPDDGDLPGLPPEWGSIVVPNDPAELADEASTIRRQLRREARRARIRRLFGLRPARRHRHASGQGLTTALVVMAIAIVTTLISLFAVTWDHRDAGSLGTTSTGSTLGGAPALSNLTFADGTGKSLRLGTVLPAVLILTDDCACTELVAATAASVPKGANVIAVGSSAPTLQNPAPNTHAIADPRGVLRGRYAVGITPLANRPTVLLIDKADTVTMIPAAGSVQDIVSRIAALQDSGTPTD